MATVSSLGTGSGLELSTLLTKLMAAEQTPLTALKVKEASYNANITSYGTLRAALDTLQTAVTAMAPNTGKTAIEKFATFGAGVGDTSVASATASTGAVAGSYSLSDITLATAQQVRRTDITVPATAGSLKIKVGAADAVDVTIEAGSSLSKVVSAINASNAGVTATVVNDGSKDYLLVTAKETGLANTISITGSGGDGWTGSTLDYPGSAPADWTQVSAAGDATLKINGIAVTSASNTLTTAISGVTLNLKKAGSTTLTVTQDTTTGITKALNDFVTAFNSANATMSSLGAYNQTTKVAGALQGNSTLRNAQSQVRNQLFAAVGTSSSAYQRLADIGLNIGKDGKLALDTTKLNKAIAADVNAVANLVGASGTAFKTTISAITGTTGTIASAIEGVNTRITANQKAQAVLTTRLTAIEKRYTAQFTTLDTVVAKIKNTGNYLTTQLESLAKLNSSNN